MIRRRRPGWRRPRVALVACCLPLAACGDPPASPTAGTATGGSTVAWRVRVHDAPAGEPSAQPNLATDGTRLYLSWIEQPAGRSSLVRMAAATAKPYGLDWSAPSTIADSGELFVNWADFPSVLPLDDRRLVAHWLRRSGETPHAYDVMLTASRDGGRSWASPVSPHRDGTASEHGFVSLVPLRGTTVGVVWLDGRRVDADRAMQLMYTPWDGAELGPEVVLDDRVCDCCQTAAVRTADGLLVAYRDRDVDERRDISLVRLDAGGWSDPVTVHRDGWIYPACPVNGPVLARSGSTVALAWYTEQPAPRVLVALSEDDGRTFGDPLRIDGGAALGRLSLAAPGDGSLVVVWLERSDDDRAEIRARRVTGSRLGPEVILGTTSPSRASGFPRAVGWRGALWTAWTDSGPPSRVRLAVLQPAG